MPIVDDMQIWVRVTTRSGFDVWSSPIFTYREPSGEH